MCKECGCGIVGDIHIDGTPGQASASPLLAASGVAASEAITSHVHGHHHPEHGHNHEHAADASRRTLDVHQAILERNDRIAERNRGFFKAKGLLVLNMVSSPGSGKTTLIQQTAARLAGRLRTGVIVGDLATDNDAARLRSAGVPVVQITTGTVCHLEAEMVARSLGKLDCDALDLLIIENVGNLVCPAMFDLGEDLRVVLLSVTEGEDKPLKYPPMFHSAHVAVLAKTDLASACEFDREQSLANLRRISHHATLFELSARTGAGVDTWCEFLVAQHRAVKG